MKTLITTLNSQYIHSNLAVKYLYSAVADDIKSVDLREYTINNEDSYVFGEIIKGDYDLVAFSCYIWNIEKIMYLAENLKKAKPEIQILMGGPEVSYDALELLMEKKFINYILQGEGEHSFRELLQLLQPNEPANREINLGDELSKISGLIYRYQGKVYINQAALPLKMDSIPFPYLHVPPKEDKTVYYESSRGCPHRCSYCISSLEKQVRALSKERVFEDLRYFLIKKVKQVKFIDRTFNYDKNRSYDIFKYIIENDNGVTNFHFEMCADFIDFPLLELLSTARKGLFQFEIGVQSTNRDALAAVDRRTDVKLILENIHKLMLLENIEIHADLIAGLPFEDYSSFKSSFNNLYRVMPHQLALGFLKLLKGTKIRKEADKYGYIYREKAPYEVISNKFISAKELVRLHQIENVLDLYYNRGGFTQSLIYMVEKAGNPFSFYEEFADYYYYKGFQHVYHKKEDLYRILYSFALENPKYQEADIYSLQIQELLHKDMENTLNFDAVKKFDKRGWELN